ncbi:MAG: hypothetical protein NTV67_02020 [Chloroflexi bacterium]|jgi:hypothetical protein|nr:hypothetical protein [Chloroflexota bacterium]
MDSKNLYIVAAAASLALSIAHYFGVGFVANAETAIYIGLWVPAILSLGSLLSKKGK